MDDSAKIYAIIFTYAVECPYFKKRPEIIFENRPLSFKGHLKYCLIKLFNVSQSEVAMKIIFLTLIINIMYERYLNF